MILGLDFGTKTGVAWGSAGVPPSQVQTETWTLPAGGGDDVGAIMHAMRKRLEDRLCRGIELAVFEAPYIARHRGINGKWVESPNQVRRAYGFAAVCEEACYARSIPCIEVPPSTLKKLLAGHGRSDKGAMVFAAARRGFSVANDHEADAVACWLHAVTHKHAKHAFLYDPLFGRERT